MAWLLDAFSRRRWKVERGPGILIAFCQTGRVEDGAAISYFDVRAHHHNAIILNTSNFANMSAWLTFLSFHFDKEFKSLLF